MSRHGGWYAGASVLAVAGIAVAGAALVGNGRQGGIPPSSPPVAGTTAPAAARSASWTQRVDGTTELAGARRAGDLARFAPIRRKLRDDGLGHSPDAAAEGGATFAAHHLAAPARELTAATDAVIPEGADVSAEVRGRAGAGYWSEWTPADPYGRVTLPHPVDVVQVRAVLTPGLHGARPAVRSVSVTAKPTRASLRAPRPHPAYGTRVFATREGLAGAHTANGSLIRPGDHFVALPSRRALSSENGGEYTVRVCANGRCDYAPVRDVGPWNIGDDYWRRSHGKPGRPQAQAAYEDGANGGRDDLGRTVRDPAGIDLGDGTAESLGLGYGGWVRVTYVWTGVYPAYATVHAPGKYRKVTLYRGPSRTAATAGYAADGVRVGVTCQARGPSAHGRYGTSRLWDHIGPKVYVPHADTGRSDRRTLRACRPGE